MRRDWSGTGRTLGSASGGSQRGSPGAVLMVLRSARAYRTLAGSRGVRRRGRGPSYESLYLKERAEGGRGLCLLGLLVQVAAFWICAASHLGVPSPRALGVFPNPGSRGALGFCVLGMLRSKARQLCWPKDFEMAGNLSKLPSNPLRGWNPTLSIFRSEQNEQGTIKKMVLASLDFVGKTEDVRVSRTFCGPVAEWTLGCLCGWSINVDVAVVPWECSYSAPLPFRKTGASVSSDVPLPSAPPSASGERKGEQRTRKLA